MGCSWKNMAASGLIGKTENDYFGKAILHSGDEMTLAVGATFE